MWDEFQLISRLNYLGLNPKPDTQAYLYNINILITFCVRAFLLHLVGSNDDVWHDSVTNN